MGFEHSNNKPESFRVDGQAQEDLTIPSASASRLSSLPSAELSHWRERWAGKVSTPDDMLQFVNEVGCCTKQAPPGYPDLPNQYEVMGEIDSTTPDPWFWKDDLHIEKQFYYTRVFGGKPGFLSYALLPTMIATNGVTVDELLYAGTMSLETQEIYYAIERHGPIPIKSLKQMLTSDAQHAADRILQSLERQFIITKTGITGRTRGTYGYIWDLLERWEPDMLVAADRLGRKTAMAMIREHLAVFGVPADSPFYVKVLGWKL